MIQNICLFRLISANLEGRQMPDLRIDLLLNMNEVVYCDFTMDRLEEAAKMAADAFEANNQFSKEGLEGRGEVELRTVVMLKTIDAAMKKFNERNGTNYGFIKSLLYRNQLVALILSCEIHLFAEFMVPLLKGSNDPYVKAFQLFEIHNFPRNTVLMTNLLSVHKDYMNMKFSNILIEKGVQDAISYGFKTAVGGSSNPISRKIALKLGGKLINEINITQNGKEAKLYLFRIDFADIIKPIAKLLNTLWLKTAILILRIYIMNKSEIVYCDFDMSRLQEVVKMAGDAFEANNEFSKEGLEGRTSVSIQLFDAAMKKFNEQNGTNYSFIKMLLYRNKLVALVMACELYLFYEDILPLIDPEDPYVQAFKLIPKEDFPRNTALIASLLIVHKDYMKGKLSYIIMEKGINEAITNGFKSVVGGSTNPISRKLSLKLGGKLLGEVSINRNGKDGKIYLLRNDLADAIKVRPKL